MKKTIRTKVMAAILAAVCTVSTCAAATAITADAALFDPSIISSSAKTFYKTLSGSDWNYSADSNCAKITCDFNYNTNTCRFKATGVKPGTTNAVLKVEVADGKWKNVPMRFVVSSSLSVSGTQTGKEYFTSTAKTQNTNKQTNSPTNKKTNTNTNKTTNKATAKSCTYTITGCNWNYKADNLNVKITCDFNYSKRSCKFIGTAVKAGTTNATLKAQRADGKWNNTPVRFTVDSSLNIKVVKNGNVYVTNN